MKRSRVKLKTPIPIGQLLDDVLASFRRHANQDLVRVWDLWETVVGETIAGHAQPAAYKNRLLIVYTSSSAWIHQLRFSKQDIIARLNTALEGAVIDDIRFRIGPVDSSLKVDKTGLK